MLRYSAVPVNEMRLRRKWVRRAGGRASCRRISSRRARSLSRFSAASLAARLAGFFIRRLEELDDSEVPGASSRLLAPDDIRQGSDEQRRPAYLQVMRSGSQSRKTAHPVQQRFRVHAPQCSAGKIRGCPSRPTLP